MFQNIKRLAGLPSFLPFLAMCIDTWHRLAAEAEAADDRELDEPTSGFVPSRRDGASAAMRDAVLVALGPKLAEMMAGPSEPSADVCVPCVEALSVYRDIFRDPVLEALDGAENSLEFLSDVVDELRCAAVAATEAGQAFDVRRIPGGVAVSLGGERSLPIVLGPGGVRVGGERLPRVTTARETVLMVLRVLSTPGSSGGNGGGVVNASIYGPRA